MNRNARKKNLEISDSCLDLLHMLNEKSGGNFFMRKLVDEEQRLSCLVWVDSQCLMPYQNFGDVVAFDTTYQTNKYSMPFIPFTGVNHHY